MQPGIAIQVAFSQPDCQAFRVGSLSDRSMAEEIFMQFSTISPLSSPTGAELAMRVQPAAGNERAVLILSHGLAEHSLRYAAFAEFMAGRGFHIYAIDHRGHGFTKADDAPLGRFAKKDGARKVVADLLALRDHVASVHRGLPIILFGHSMGGIIAANAAAAQPSGFHGLAVWNSNLSGVYPGSTYQCLRW